MKNKIMWKDVTLIVLAILLIFSMCRIHTLKQSNKKTVLTKSGAESPACHTERKEYRFRIKAEQRRKYHR